MTGAPRAILLMTAAMAAFTANDACMKVLSERLSLMQTIFLRGVPTTFVLWLMAAQVMRRHPPMALPPRDRRMIGLRAAADVAGTVAFLSALAHMPLANLSAILQSLPLAVAVAGAVVLREPLGPARLGAVLCGFAGVLVILRPGTAAFDIWSLVGLASVAAVVVRDLVTRRISAAAPSPTVALVTALAVTLTAGVALPFAGGWRMPDPGSVGLILCAAGCLIVGHLTVVMATRAGDLAAAAPFRYTALVFAILLGWAVFGDLPDTATLVGAGIVVCAGIMAARAEWRRARVAT
jgi:drug/metabolite transporter (DMT)-like permease